MNWMFIGLVFFGAIYWIKALKNSWSFWLGLLWIFLLSNLFWRLMTIKMNYFSLSWFFLCISFEDIIQNKLS
jgi:hypothetical protein